MYPLEITVNVHTKLLLLLLGLILTNKLGHLLQKLHLRITFGLRICPSQSLATPIAVPIAVVIVQLVASRPIVVWTTLSEEFGTVPQAAQSVGELSQAFVVLAKDYLWKSAPPAANLLQLKWL